MDVNRCAWAQNVPELYRDYHDNEWGKPLRGDDELFERICLEGFQAGLSWWSVLQRREFFRTEFEGFLINRLVDWDEARIEKALSNPGIIRNRAKVKAVVTNARAASAFKPGELTDLIWSFSGESPMRYSVKELPATTPTSEALSAALRRSGFVFIGPTTCYALMQACGLVNDHLADCAFRE